MRFEFLREHNKGLIVFAVAIALGAGGCMAQAQDDASAARLWTETARLAGIE